MNTRLEPHSKTPIAYLLDNGAQYHIANGIAVLEYVVVKLFFPSAKAWPYVTEIGMGLSPLVQNPSKLTLRRPRCRIRWPVPAFNGYDLRFDQLLPCCRVLQEARTRTGHRRHLRVSPADKCFAVATLTPLYSWFRHPSYAGFFYWALGTQLVLQNPISFAMYAVVLWRFFYYRTRGGCVLTGQRSNAHPDMQPRRSISSTSSGKSTNSIGRGSRFGYPSSLRRPCSLPFDFR